MTLVQDLKIDVPIFAYTVDTDLGAAREIRVAESSDSEDDLAMIFFTSGTTADPKGVMHTHRSLLANVESCSRLFSVGPGDTTLSFLPVSHVYQQVVDTVALLVGATVAFVARPDEVPAALQEVNPTVMVAVPRMFEVMANILPRRVESKLKDKSVILRWLVPVAMRVGQKNYSSSLLERAQARATNFVLRPIRKKVQKEVLGSRMRFLISGGAPLPVHIGAFIQGALEVPVYQGWGMTELAGGATCNTQGRNVLGSCGSAVPGAQVKLGPLPAELRADLPEDAGEILVRGPMVTTGYYQEPDATAEAIRDGWIRTGDVGVIDASGYMWILDRIKGFIVLKNGLKIMAQSLEDRVRSFCPLIEQIVVVGDDRPHLVALVYPNTLMLEERASEPHRDSQGAWTDATKAAVVAELRAVDLAPHERVRNVALLEEPLSPEDETLTPTHKPRRRVIRERYQSLIEGLYS